VQVVGWPRRAGTCCAARPASLAIPCTSATTYTHHEACRLTTSYLTIAVSPPHLTPTLKPPPFVNPPISTSTGAPGLAVSMAPPTSPSLIMRMRAPASRIWRISSAWRGRSRISTVTSLESASGGQ
jgi:hypothetical protein